MAKSFTPKIVSANDLFDGDVVYLDDDGAWTRHLAKAAVAKTPAGADALLHRATQPGLVIGPFLVDVALDEGAPRPEHFRDHFREYGPSNRTDLGRQADFALTAGGL